MASRKNVPAAVVRAWARDNITLIPEGARACLGKTARGRLHPEVQTAYAKHNKGKAYTPKVAEAPTFTVPVETLDKAGRKTTVKRSFTNSEARTLLGQVDGSGKMQRGRMAHSTLSLAASAAEAESLDFSKFQ